MANNNIYGVQKIPEQNNVDQAGIALSGASSGAKMGSKAGPWGALAGGVIGGGMGMIKADQLKGQENYANDRISTHNKFVDRLQTGQRYQTVPQAENGAVATSDGLIEAQGDGTGNPAGGGEIRLREKDGKFYIIDINRGAKTHEQGGDRVEVQEGDIILPTQSKAETEKMMRDIARANEGNQSSISLVKQAIDAVPEMEPVGAEAQHSLEPENNANDVNIDTQKQGPREMETQVGQDVQLNTGPVVGGPDDTVPDSPKMFDDENNESLVDTVGDIGKYDVATAQETVPLDSVAQSDEIMKKAAEVAANEENLDSPVTPESAKTNEPTLEDTVSQIGNYEMELESLDNMALEPQAGDSAIGTDGVVDDTMIPLTPEANTALEDEMASEEFGPLKSERYQTTPVGEDVSLKATQPKPVDYKSQSTAALMQDMNDQDDPFAYDPIKKNVNPLSYANVAYNLMQGQKAPETVERRSVTPEQVQYKDRSAQARSDTRMQGNAARNQLRGKGLSAGQRHNYNAQITAQQNRALARIGESEAKRYDMVQAGNVQTKNQAGMANFQAAIQADDKDAQNRAAMQKYSDAAFKELASLSERDTRTKYAMDRDNRAFDQDTEVMRNMQSGDYGNTGRYGGVEYRGGNRYKK